jgi:DNA replication and repair protein RecF
MRAPVTAVRLGRLAVRDFRSWAQADLSLDGRSVVLVGANGAGKTNLLEALSMLGLGRGLRHARLHELPRIGGSGGWAVSATLGGDTRLGVGASAEAPGRRECRIDGCSVSGPSAFAEHLRLLWLTPAQDRLFADGASERRRFFDRMAQAREPAHGRAAAAYDLALRQRQRLLEEQSGAEAWLDALEAQMAESGVALAAARRETMSALAAADVGDLQEIFPAADLALEGDIEALLERAPAADVEAEFAARLRRERRADAAAGRPLAGPHRSDLLVSHRKSGRPARVCSTGEQKGLLVGLILAQARSLALEASFRGEKAPLVLLLDEIAAHFDEERRRALFEILDELGFQTFMTGTDKSLFAALGSRAQGFEARGGALVETELGRA